MYKLLGLLCRIEFYGPWTSRMNAKGTVELQPILFFFFFLYIHTHTTHFCLIGHIQMYKLALACRFYTATADAVGSFVDWYCAAIQVFRFFFPVLGSRLFFVLM
jgi:hypothetical protein